MSENPKQKEGIKFFRDVGEPRNKTKGSNQGMMPKNPKQNEGIESENDAGEPEIK